MKTKKRPKLNDPGEWRFDVASDPNKGTVTIRFERPVSFLAFLPDSARQLARDLVEEAKRVDRRRLQ